MMKLGRWRRRAPVTDEGALGAQHVPLGLERCGEVGVDELALDPVGEPHGHPRVVGVVPFVPPLSGARGPRILGAFPPK